MGSKIEGSFRIVTTGDQNQADGLTGPSFSPPHPSSLAPYTFLSSCSFLLLSLSTHNFWLVSPSPTCLCFSASLSLFPIPFYFVLLLSVLWFSLLLTFLPPSLFLGASLPAYDIFKENMSYTQTMLN